MPRFAASLRTALHPGALVFMNVHGSKTRHSARFHPFQLSSTTHNAHTQHISAPLAPMLTFPPTPTSAIPLEEEQQRDVFDTLHQQDTFSWNNPDPVGRALVWARWRSCQTQDICVWYATPRGASSVIQVSDIYNGRSPRKFLSTPRAPTSSTLLPLASPTTLSPASTISSTPIQKRSACPPFTVRNLFYI
jgi:hypothetical protein